MTLKEFSGFKWWEQNNPAYREACKRQASRELIELNIGYEFYIKNTVKQEKSKNY